MKKASIFTIGQDQAVRIPAEFRFAGTEVFIERDARTGNVILSEAPRKNTWQEFMAFRESLGLIPKDFSEAQPADEREWVDAPRVGKEII